MRVFFSPIRSLDLFAKRGNPVLLLQLQISTGETENSSVLTRTMGDYQELVILVGVALFLTLGKCSDSCRGENGHAGVPGTSGRDGWPGEKGQKGEPAVKKNDPVDVGVLWNLKGEPGNRGAQGSMGTQGFAGVTGPGGPAGHPGRPGPDGRGQGENSPQQSRSAFSAIRTENSLPRLNQPVTFQRTVVNTMGDFNTATGHFTCRVAGVYYFTFHSVAKVSMCLQIASDGAAPQRLGFCDYHKDRNDQVLSGGVVLKLVAGQKVWLQSFRDQQTDVGDISEKQIIFNGFLLFQDAE
ncbi:complement C1q subcomponent subunit A [Channa argus]|uniref:complement C1q subcomponent subunit A n=1 Tax=Channa argus TaxID=215402 RepID=UPI00351FCC6A